MFVELHTELFSITTDKNKICNKNNSCRQKIRRRNSSDSITYIDQDSSMYTFDATTSFENSNRKKYLSVSFGTAQVREYERILDIDPDLPMKLSLGWDYTDRKSISIDEYKNKSIRSNRKNNKKRSTSKRTSIEERFNILFLQYGFSLESLREAESIRLQKQEEVEMKNIIVSSGLLKRILLRRKNS
jgi:hypothetical protein